MDLKKEVKDIIKWAQENEENKKQAINAATMIISLLNQSKGLDKIDLEKISGGCDVISATDSSGTFIWSCD
jgi:hypothetical protein